MSGAGLSYGLNIKKKPNDSRAHLQKSRIIFDEDEDRYDEHKSSDAEVEEVREIGDIGSHLPASIVLEPKKSLSSRGGKRLLAGKSRPAISMYGDLSTTFTSKKHADTAKDLDENIYDYDAVYDSLKPQKRAKEEDEDRKPRYMASLFEAVAIRKRDAAIAEERKLAREREAEGDEYADKEKFITSGYKKKQEENRRLEEEERIREEQESKKNKDKGMTSFYKKVLEKGDQRHAEIVKAVDERIKNGPVAQEETIKLNSAAELAREINEKKAGAITVNDEGDVVDKRQLLAGGLNIISKPKTTASLNTNQTRQNEAQSKGSGYMGVGRGKQAMRERQSRMIEEQLEKTTKRALEQDKEEKKKIEEASKCRKTETEIMSSKERYLARKRAAEEKSQKAG